MPEYNLIKGSPQDLFGDLRTQIQIFGGGYGNGKTAASIMRKALPIAQAYPGANILIARSTYPKLNDTIRKEFLKWCPQKWIKSFPRSKNSDNTCTLVNGTVINFRYIAQQGKGASEGEQTISNLLSATYDLIIVDQLEDPEITEKDFDDLLGRLRGNAKYIGDDPTMPSTGPRWFIGLLNPTRNWAYRKIIAPYHQWVKHGTISDDLLCVRYPRDHEKAGQPVLDDNGKPRMLVSMVEGSTYTNAHNLGKDYIETLESVYRGQQRDRMLYGEWAAYEGLVHPAYDASTHQLTQDQMRSYLYELMHRGIMPKYLEGYDYGMVSPSCYLLAFKDHERNIFICDGFYAPEQEMSIQAQQAMIAQMRDEWLCDASNTIFADPAISRRTVAQRKSMAKTIAQLFREGDYPINMGTANNDIASGITRVNQYLEPKPMHRHPITRTLGAPNIYIASELQFFDTEITAYYWQQDSSGQRVDKPVDKNDHAMNTVKYLLSREIGLATLPSKGPDLSHLTAWHEIEDAQTNRRAHRYG